MPKEFQNMSHQLTRPANIQGTYSNQIKERQESLLEKSSLSIQRVNDSNHLYWNNTERPVNISQATPIYAKVQNNDALLDDLHNTRNTELSIISNNINQNQQQL